MSLSLDFYQKARLQTDQIPSSRSEDWLNSGIKGNGWTAPYLNFSTVLHVDRPTFYGHVGAPCKEYDQFFQVGGDGHGIDPVILAFIAMQESSCNADAGGPTPGLMQVSCENYPNGVCTDSIQDNVNAGANYLRGRLDAANNNAIKAIGSYNGWFTAGQGLNGNRGLTEGYPCSAEGKSNGEPQNLNYLMQTLNGWFLGLDVYGDQNWIGKYKCQGNCDNGNIC